MSVHSREDFPEINITKNASDEEIKIYKENLKKLLNVPTSEKKKNKEEEDDWDNWGKASNINKSKREKEKIVKKESIDKEDIYKKAAARSEYKKAADNFFQAVKDEEDENEWGNWKKASNKSKKKREQEQMIYDLDAQSKEYDNQPAELKSVDISEKSNIKELIKEEKKEEKKKVGKQAEKVYKKAYNIKLPIIAEETPYDIYKVNNPDPKVQSRVSHLPSNAYKERYDKLIEEKYSQNKNKLKNPNIEPKKPSFFSRYFGFGRGIKSKKIKKNKKLKNNSVKRNLTKSKNKRKTSRK